MTHDLSGHWSGVFNYPRDYPPTAFDADITDRGGMIVGSVDEPDLWSDTGDGRLRASIDGRHDDNAVTFAKIYDGNDAGCDIVQYQGIISADGCEISGQWEIVGVWSGTFLMIRPAAVAVEEEREALEPIVLD